MGKTARAASDLRQRYHAELAAWWRLLPDDDNDRHAWEEEWLHREMFGPDEALAAADAALADVARDLADAAVTLNVEGATLLRRWECELRESSVDLSRVPSLMLPEVKAVAANVLMAHEAKASPSSDRADVPLDFARDAVCIAIAKALWHKPEGMKPMVDTHGNPKAGGLVALCGARANTFKDRIGKMYEAGLVDQLKAKWPWFLTDKGRKLFAPALSKAPRLIALAPATAARSR